MDNTQMTNIFGGYDPEDEDTLNFLNHIPDQGGHLKRLKRLPEDSPSPPGFSRSNGRWFDPLKGKKLSISFCIEILDIAAHFSAFCRLASCHMLRRWGVQMQMHMQLHSPVHIAFWAAGIFMQEKKKRLLNKAHC